LQPYKYAAERRPRSAHYGVALLVAVKPRALRRAAFTVTGLDCAAWPRARVAVTAAENA